MKDQECKWFELCVLKNYESGCDGEDKESCDMFKYIAQEITKFCAEIKKTLKERSSFSYNERWYKTAKGNLLGGGLIISKKGFTKIEDQIIEEILKSRAQK